MSSEILRRAASLMRERAEAATPGPWSAADEHELIGPGATPAWCVSNMRPGYQAMSEVDGYLGDVAETSLGFQSENDGPNAEHIASWHPAVALAVADWLDAYAYRAETLGHLIGGNGVEALAVARAYLGADA